MAGEDQHQPGEHVAECLLRRDADEEMASAPPTRSWLTGTPNSTSVMTSVVNSPTTKIAYRTMAECAGPAFGSSSFLDFPARP